MTYTKMRQVIRPTSSTKPCPKCKANMIIEREDSALAVDFHPEHWACMCGYREEFETKEVKPEPLFEDRWKAAQE